MREEKMINNGWKFLFGDYLEAKEKDYIDSDWYDICLPHTFSLPYFMENEFYVGYGCYRKLIVIQKEWTLKEISLIFGAAFQSAEVYVNGVLAGVHKGGYTAFQIPIAHLVREGENLLFVRLNNLWDGELAPRAGEHVFSGGLYREVSLLLTDQIHVNWNGTFVYGEEVSQEEAAMKLLTELVNKRDTEVTCRLESVISQGGEELEKLVELVKLPANSQITKESAFWISSPSLWHPEHPALYLLKTRLYVNDCLCDLYETTFGIRYFKFDKEEGFFLNGEHYEIQGANVHQDHAGWGDAITRTALGRDVQMIKDCGMNFIRGSHYPHHPCFSKACDEKGLLFWSELCFWGTGGPDADGYWTASGYPVKEEEEEGFEKSCMDTLEEMIRQNRNSPSIVIWSMCNEPFFSAAQVQDKACRLARKLVEKSHELDPSRPAGLGGVQRGNFDLIGDVAGYNGDGASIYIHPDVPNLVTEYGSVVGDRPGVFSPNFRDNAERRYKWRSGRALWCAFHHGSIFGDMGHMGMIDYARLPLNTYYWYRKELRGIEPEEEHKEGIPYGLSLTTDRQTIKTDGTEDAFLIISLLDKEGRILSNTAEVTLRVEEGGGLFPTGTSMVFSPENGRFLDGQGAVEFRTAYEGKNRITASAEGIRTAELIITGQGGEVWQGQKRILPQPPPYKTGMPVPPEGTVLSIHKPVFCSSCLDGHPASCLTEENEEIWNAEGSGQWVMADLEGTNRVTVVEIEFAEKAAEGYRVSYSCDGNEFTELSAGIVKDELLLSYHLVPTKMRYVRVCFHGETQPLKRIRIYG